MRLNYNEKSKRIGNNFQFTCFPPTFVGHSYRDLQMFMRPLFHYLFDSPSFACIPAPASKSKSETETETESDAPFWPTEGTSRLIKLLMFLGTEEGSPVSVGVSCLQTISEAPAAK